MFDDSRNRCCRSDWYKSWENDGNDWNDDGNDDDEDDCCCCCGYDENDDDGGNVNCWRSGGDIADTGDGCCSVA